MSKKVTPQEADSYTRMTGELYDLIYAGKDYESQAAQLAKIIHKQSQSGDDRVLEAACGTGTYMHFLAKNFTIDGFDLSAEQVEAAKKKLPDAHIVQADMLDFDFGQQYDAVLCLFSSIGYLLTKENLDKAIANFAKHTKPGGVVVIEPWLKEEDIIPGRFSMDQGKNDDVAVQRMGTLVQENGVSTMRMHHMVATGESVEHFVETHMLATYTDKDFSNAYKKAGLSFDFDPKGLTGRGLYIGQMPLISQ